MRVIKLTFLVNLQDEVSQIFEEASGPQEMHKWLLACLSPAVEPTINKELTKLYADCVQLTKRKK